MVSSMGLGRAIDNASESSVFSSLRDRASGMTASVVVLSGAGTWWSCTCWWAVTEVDTPSSFLVCSAIADSLAPVGVVCSMGIGRMGIGRAIKMVADSSVVYSVVNVSPS